MSPERPYPELDELAVPVDLPVAPLSYRVDAIEKLADTLADTAEKLRDEFQILTRNLDSIVGYLREVNQRMGELSSWRDQAERRLQMLERKP